MWIVTYLTSFGLGLAGDLFEADFESVESLARLEFAVDVADLVFVGGFVEPDDLELMTQIDQYKESEKINHIRRLWWYSYICTIRLCSLLGSRWITMLLKAY